MEIRQATINDIPTIYDFICELASYEKLRHEVVATEDILRETLFGARAYAEVVLAIENDSAVGFALFFHNFSTFLGRPGMYLEDLYVKPDYRGKGVGKQLLSYLANLTIQRHCGRLEWCVLNWNKPAIAVYEFIGADAMDEWTTYRITGTQLQKLATQFGNT